MGEITLEANPGTFEQAHFEGYRAAGVTRLSVGVQSFDDACLQALGRVHDGQQARQAVLSAMQCFERVNVDLMYNLPGQTVAMAQHDVQTALGMGVGHLSLYQLTLEPNTQFALQPPTLPLEDEQYAIEEAVHALAAQAGLQRYEVSAFAKPGQRCQHNLNYWGFGDYLGIGAGAHAKLSFPGAIERQVRVRKPMAYLEAVEQGVAGHLECTPVAVSELPFEFMLNAMRLAEGVPNTWYLERCGRPMADLQAALQHATTRGLVEQDPTRLQPTPLGFRYLNDLLDLFLPKR
jgi:putative oxygen-independent coproporphyrinogen III oxidase